jgi:hypothetical protein
VRSFRRALDHLAAHGYRPDAREEALRIKVSLEPTAGFPQIFVLDPDRNVIEINAAHLD